MKRFIDQVAGQAEGVDVGGDVKKIKSGGDLDASLGQQVNNGSTPFSGGRGGGGGRFRGRGGRYRDRNQGVAPSPTGMSLGMNALTNGEVQIKSVFNLKKEMAGAVIGRGGAKVQKMREETGALIHVCPPVKKTDVERAVEITGLIDKVQAAEMQVYDLMIETDKEWTEVESSGPRVEIQILPEMVGCVMGRGGSRIKSLRQDLQVEIHAAQKKDDPDLQVVTVSGTALQAHAAHARILQHLKEFEPSKSKMLLKRVQQGDPSKKIEVHQGMGGFGGQQGSSGSMMMMQGGQLGAPQVQSNAQVLIQQPDGSYALAQVMLPGGALPGAPMASTLGGPLMGQGGIQLVQPPLVAATQLPMNFGMQQDGSQISSQTMQSLAGGSFGGAVGLDMQQQQFGLQGGILKGQLPPSNPNAHQFGN